MELQNKRYNLPGHITGRKVSNKIQSKLTKKKFKKIKKNALKVQLQLRCEVSDSHLGEKNMTRHDMIYVQTP